TGENVAVEIEDCLADFGLKDKVSMITVDNAANMEVAAEKAGIMKLGCFAHNLNLAAQKAVDNPESESVRHFLEEAAALDPRFKGTVTHDDAVWERLAALVNRDNIGTCTIQQEPAGCESDCAAGNSEELEKPSKIRKSGLAELFEDEDEVLITHVEAPESDHMRAFKEVEDYRATRGITNLYLTPDNKTLTYYMYRCR
ncbi:Zinc finger BED domain containing protein RICESLEEPER 3, partial [Dissostichus eleginoides]